jgi:hypothetical protein
MLTITTLLMLRPDDDVAQRMARALRWLLQNTYANGEPFDIVDERERYHLHPPDKSGTFHFAPLLGYCRGGRQMIARKLAQGRQPGGTSVAKFWNFTWAVQKANPRFAEILEDAGDWAAQREKFSFVYANRKSAAAVSQPWTMVAHGYLIPPVAPMGMWHRDLQEHFSLYHRHAGVILGGGNSLAQPEFSTLLAGASFLCDEVTVEKCTDSQLSVLLGNAGFRVRLEGSIVSKNECRVVARVLAAGEGHAFLQLPLCFYDHRKFLMCDDELITEFNEHPCSGTFAKPLEVRGEGLDGGYTARISFDQPCTYQWPVVPVNVRAPGREPMAFGNAVLPLKFKLGAAGSEIRFTVQVHPA